jgi:hypothetical protein
MANPSPGNSFEFLNSFEFGVRTATRTSAVDLAIGASLDSKELAGLGNSTGLFDPYAKASFTREGPNSNLSLDGSLKRTDLDTSRLSYDAGGGDLQAASIGGRFTFGVDAPFGGSVGARYSQDDYIGNSDPDNDDNETRQWDARADIALNSKVTLSPTVSQVDYRVDDAFNTRTLTSSAGLTATAAVSETLSVDASASREEIDVTLLGVTTTSSAPGWTLGATVETASSSQRFAVGQALSTNGTRTSLSFDRSFETASNTGGFGIGLVRTASGGNEWTVSANLTQPFSNGALSVNISRAVITASGGEEEVKASLDTDLRYELSEEASVVLGFDLGQSYDTASGPSGSDGKLSASYERKVTDEWDLVAGYEHRFDDNGGGTVTRSNAVFVTMSRSWVSLR